MKPLNLLHIVESTLAGVGRHARYLCLDLAERGHQVTLAYSKKRLDAQFRQFVAETRSVRCLSVNMERSPHPVHDVRSVSSLQTILKQYGPFDIIHGHSSKGGALARIVGRLNALPTVYTPNGLIMASPDLSVLERAIYTTIEWGLGRLATSAIIAVCEDEKQLMLQLGLQREERVFTIENTLTDTDYQTIEAVAVAHKPSDQFTFGAMMRFSEQKDPENLVRAFHRFRQSYTLPFPVRVVVAGDGPLFSKVQALVRERDLVGPIELLGWQTETYKLMKSFDALVLPSNYEGFSYMILEAMAAGLPIVSTNISGSSDTVGKVPGNIIVPHSNPAALAEGMYRMIAPARETGLAKLREGLAAIGQANNVYVRQQFHQSVATEKTLKLYYSLIH
jgi:glycosyltransferase involved in cell wall biosynthesis